MSEGGLEDCMKSKINTKSWNEHTFRIKRKEETLLTIFSMDDLIEMKMDIIKEHQTYEGYYCPHCDMYALSAYESVLNKYLRYLIG